MSRGMIIKKLEKELDEWLRSYAVRERHNVEGSLAIHNIAVHLYDKMYVEVRHHCKYKDLKDMIKGWHYED